MSRFAIFISEISISRYTIIRYSKLRVGASFFLSFYYGLLSRHIFEYSSQLMKINFDSVKFSTKMFQNIEKSRPGEIQSLLFFSKVPPYSFSCNLNMGFQKFNSYHLNIQIQFYNANIYVQCVQYRILFKISRTALCATK